MRRVAALLIVLFASPAWAQANAAPPPRTEAWRLTTAVISAGLSFIAPRALQPVSVPELAVWGLTAPSALDAALTTEWRDDAVLLLQRGQIAYRRPVPPDAGAGAWAEAAADVLEAAAAVSPSFRAGGTQGAITAFFDELFNHLDPYSRHVPPAAASLDRARRSGEAGAGIQVQLIRGAFIVTDVNADGPGAGAGIRVGDSVTAVDGQPTAGQDLPAVLARIIGLEGADVSLAIRDRRGRSRRVVVERAVTPPETVFATRLPGVLLIRLTSFSRDTDERLATELIRNLSGAAGRSIGAVVLDLRGNRGGLLRQAVESANLLLNGGVIATASGRNPQADREWIAAEGDLSGGRPIVIMVDGRSASAAEIMAAALSDQGRAVLVGSSTLGKGLVQTIDTLPDGGELFVSWSRVLAPAGWPLQGLGVLPQVCTSLGQDDVSRQLNLLQQGVQPMADALARHRAARAPLPGAEALALRNACPAAGARDTDLSAARFLATHPPAYSAARLQAP